MIQKLLNALAAEFRLVGARSRTAFGNVGT